MRKAKIPVMEIYNYEQAKAGCGYFLVEYVPHPFVVPWEIGTHLQDLTQPERVILEEIRHLLQQP
jgi:hypothetical protein